MLLEFVAWHDVPCPLCGYNLRGMRSATCPECGSDVTLRVGLAEPRMGAFITTVVALSLGMGASLFLGAIALTQAPSDWWERLGAKMLLVMIFLSILAFTLVLSLRRAIRKQSSSVQWVIAVMSAVLMLGLGAMVLVFFEER